jgi:hypothetical protein
LVPRNRDLLDGKYRFDVRAIGEVVSDSRSFMVDTTPPVAAFTAAPTPVVVKPVAAFSFRASDQSPVAFECRLRRLDGSAASPPSLSGALEALDAWANCNSPAEVRRLLSLIWRSSPVSAGLKSVDEV